MKKENFCTACFSWSLREKSCADCGKDFSASSVCADCGFLYEEKNIEAKTCRYCREVRPICFEWYPTDKEDCLKMIEEYGDSSEEWEEGEILGGVVPHAGWYFSGQVALKVFRALKAQGSPETVVIFGAVHRVRLTRPCLMWSGYWDTPLGKVEIDTELNAGLLGHFSDLEISSQTQKSEHSIELEVPFVKHFFPEAKILPLMTPPEVDCSQLGQAVAKAAEELGRKVVFLGSSDFSHYGRSYGYMPYGELPEALEKVHKIDRRLIDLTLNFDDDAIIPEAREHRSACGPGALSATVAASRALGAEKSTLLEYTTSAEIRPKESGDSAVGYAAILLGK